MTDVESSSTAPLGGRQQTSAWRFTALGGAVVAFLSTALLAAPVGPAAGDPLSAARAQAAAINAQLQADAARVDAITQQYEEAQARVEQLNSQIDHIKNTIASDQAQVQSDQIDLRHQAIATYMSSGDGSAFDTLFNAGGQSAAVASEYRAVANGNISTAIDSLNVAQRALAAQEQQLQSAQAQAQTALDAVAATRQAAESAVSAQEATLAGVKGQIASLVAQQQAAEQAAQHAAFLSRVGSLQNVPASGGASTAVKAAESQIGVPYQWGAEDPGVAFDCSGLTQWAWRQAGVGIPRTAQGQYDAIVHVPLGALEPGDLVFWGDGPGGITHVGMYVGGGDVVHAPHEGTTVQIDPIWNDGLVGAGRP